MFIVVLYFVGNCYARGNDESIFQISYFLGAKDAKFNMMVINTFVFPKRPKTGTKLFGSVSEI